MGRTAAAGIRISAGKSSKKVGGNTQPSSVVSAKSGGSSNKLPPIPHQETPSWQKPITSFFKSNSPTKSVEENDKAKGTEPLEDEQVEETGPSKKQKLDDENGIEETTTETHLEENKENKCTDTPQFDAGASSSKE